MHRFHHLRFAAPLLQRIGRVGIDAVGALHRVRNAERYQGLLPGRERSFLEHLTIIVEEFLAEFFLELRDPAEVLQVRRIVIGLLHKVPKVV